MHSPTLLQVYRGWDGHEEALENAVEELTPEQLAFRPLPTLRSPGEIVAHIAFGRLDWFHRMGAPGSGELARRIDPLAGEKVNTENRGDLLRWMQAVEDYGEKVPRDAATLLAWLRATWAMVEETLTTWTVADLEQSFRHLYQGTVYEVSRQWVLWRILSHDIHHGGELAILLGLQGIEIPDLGDQGGHLTELVEALPEDDESE